MTKEHTPEEIKYRLSDLGVQIGDIAIEYITELEEEKCELLGLIQGKDKVIAELKEKLEAMTVDRDRWLNVDKENCGNLKEAKEIINNFLDFEASAMERGCYIADDTRRRAEDFIKE